MQTRRDEIVYVDVTSATSDMIFPALESIVITGIAWMLIGFVDRQAYWEFAPTAHNILVLLWGLLVLMRLVMPLLRQRQRRIMVTDQRIILKAPQIRGAMEIIPLEELYDVARRRRDIFLAVRGHDRSIYLPKVPKAKKVAAQIEELLAYRHR